MSRRLHFLYSMSTVALIACAAGSLHAQQAQNSPMAGMPEESMNFPAGSRLESSYSSVNKDLGIGETPAATRGATTGLAAASEIQAELPPGYTLLPAPTAHITEAAAGAAAPTGASDKYITVYPLQYNGVPLSKGSDYMAMVSGTGTLLVTRQRGLPESVDGTDPSVPAEAAVPVATADASEYLGTAEPKVSAPALEIWVNEAKQGRLAWTFTVESESLTEPKSRRYWVAALGEPEVLNWESEIYHTHQGTVTGTMWTASPFDGTASRPLQGLRVVRSTGGAKATGPDGRYGFDDGAGAANISAALDGANVDLQNQSGPDMTRNKNGTPANAIDLNFGPTTNEERAQVSAAYWTEKAHELAGSILAPTDLPNLITRTNINDTCNAFWNGNSINFFREGDGCPNTAYSDVVFHEYGHGVDSRKGGIVDGGYSEGFGDAMALLGTRQSCLGRDFFGDGTCLRPATDVILWPPNPGDGVHAIGRRYAGFSWELIQQLAKTYGDTGAYDIASRLILAAAAANPANIPDAVHLSFLADDTDGNLANGTPHFKELAAAADSRNIPRPADPTAMVAGGVGVSGHFPFTDHKTVSANENILSVNLHLDEPSVVHISANSSAQSAAPLSFRTGFYNQSVQNVIWTNSYRNVSLSNANQWGNFGSKFSLQLPAGDHTIYWKIWINSGTITLSSGSLQVETFRAPGMMAIASPVTTTEGLEMIEPAAGPSTVETQSADANGEPITIENGQ
ncbi:MAG TPA: hypothetical protein VH835_04885 [Dongiaceae bacterium]|jgi:hypothetical protein